MNKHLSIALTMSALVGCAADPAPHEQLRLTQQALDQARAVGASDQITELQQAEQKLALAIAAMRDENYRAARLQAEQAELDARLAEARVLNEKSGLELAELNRRIALIRRQLGEMH